MNIVASSVVGKSPTKKKNILQIYNWSTIYKNTKSQDNWTKERKIRTSSTLRKKNVCFFFGEY